MWKGLQAQLDPKALMMLSGLSYSPSVRFFSHSSPCVEFILERVFPHGGGWPPRTPGFLSNPVGTDFVFQ